MQNVNGNSVGYLYHKDEVDKIIQEARESVDTIWMITAAVWVMMMQIGFAMFEAGSIRQKNLSNILLKCVIDIFTGILSFFIVGYGIMNGLQGGIIGTGPFLGYITEKKQMIDFLFSYSFCATSTTIVSGAMAERMQIDSYIAYSLLMTGFIYPVSAGWAWGGGWLQQLGYRDFSGSGVVHIVGGMAGFVGTIICGPRLGIMGKHWKSVNIVKKENIRPNIQQQVSISENRSQCSNKNYSDIEDSQHEVQKENINFEISQGLPLPERVRIFKQEFPEFQDYQNESVQYLITLYDQNFDKKYQYYSIPMIVSGAYLLWVCWLFFNASAGKTITKRGYDNIPQVTIMNSMISGSVSALVVFYCYPYFMNQRGHLKYNYNPVDICNGLLAGLVSITASCNHVENYAAFVIGLLGGFTYIAACRMLLHFQIDDPCAASQIHGFCGMWGALAVGFFDRERGLFYTGNFRQLGIQSIGLAAFALWSIFMAFPYFYTLMKIGRLRVPPLYEIIGMDIMMHEERDKLSHIDKKAIQVLEEQRRAQSMRQQQMQREKREQDIIKMQVYQQRWSRQPSYAKENDNIMK